MPSENKQDSSNSRSHRRITHHSLLLIAIDFCLLLLTDVFFLVLYPSSINVLGPNGIIVQFLLSAAVIFVFRWVMKVYRQIWRFARTVAFMRLIISDGVAACVFVLAQALSFVPSIPLVRACCMVAINLLLTMTSRLVYQYLYEGDRHLPARLVHLRNITSKLSGTGVIPDRAAFRINIAIIGAGKNGTSLADDLITNPSSIYRPQCFVDLDPEKIGRYIVGLKVLDANKINRQTLESYGIQEVVLALPDSDPELKREAYEHYHGLGCTVKVYDYPMSKKIENGKRQFRDIDVAELLFRNSQDFIDASTTEFYRGKTVLVSGGGGSIGSEIARQVMRMNPEHLIVLDNYENNVYELQQELKISYGKDVPLSIEIVPITDADAVGRIFRRYRPDVVLHAAAHKHVPLMEHNSCEAVKNNVFGTLNMVKSATDVGVRKFIMISTDKAVNPTNVMGATKRICEMIVQSQHSGETVFSATRFGNVLGSNGSVIPLFKQQIINGGPVTVTDKRMTRYFMTIPEAAQLVLKSGAMSHNGELYVLDMGKPVKIIDMAESMIKLAGFEPYTEIDIVETGLRPGEKLYEELLIKEGQHKKTEDEKLFIEIEKPLSWEEVEKKLQLLKSACDSGDEDKVRKALHETVPTYKEM